MGKTAKKRVAGSTAKPGSAAKNQTAAAQAKTGKRRTAVSVVPVSVRKEPAQGAAHDANIKKAHPVSKQSRVLAMLQSPDGATIAAMMQATGWQQHSVRGFLAGVVRKRLKLNLASKKVEGERFYQIASGESRKSGSAQQSKRRAA